MYSLNRYPVYGAISPVAKIPGFRNQGVEMGVAPVNVTPNGPLAKFLLSFLVTLGSAGLGVLVPKEGMLQPGNTTIPLNWKLRLPPSLNSVYLFINRQKRGYSPEQRIGTFLRKRYLKACFLSVLLIRKRKKKYAYFIFLGTAKVPNRYLRDMMVFFMCQLG